MKLLLTILFEFNCIAMEPIKVQTAFNVQNFLNSVKKTCLFSG